MAQATYDSWVKASSRSIGSNPSVFQVLINTSTDCLYSSTLRVGNSPMQRLITNRVVNIKGFSANERTLVLSHMSSASFRASSRTLCLSPTTSTCQLSHSCFTSDLSKEAMVTWVQLLAITPATWR